MATEKLFRKDPYMREFTARVVGCTEKDGKYLVELDRTCFYPEGGGQNADIGFLGEAQVTDVHESGDVILHTCLSPLETGSEVFGRIDWLRRFSLMQHHTGEHIVSGIVNRLYKLDNVGFHMGSAMVTVDFNGELTREDIDKVELLANRAVFDNIEVRESYPDPEQLAAMNYRSKKALSGEVRIIDIPSVDCCACCGTHVMKTGEVGLIKLLAPTRYKGGVRIGILCGEKALLDYRQKDNDTAEISHLLSAKQHETPQAVRRVIDELEQTKAALSAARLKLFESRIASLDLSKPMLCLFDEDSDPGELRKFGCILQERCSGAAIILSGGDGGFRYAFAAGSGDARELSKAMHQSLGGKGGGSAQLVQGFIPASRDDIERYFSAV